MRYLLRCPVRLLISVLAITPSVSSLAADGWQLGRGKWSSTLGVSYSQSKSTSEGDSASMSSSSHSLQETLGVQGTGLYVLDPRLVSLNMGFTLAHNQSSYLSQAGGFGSDSHMTDRLLGYNLDADILSTKPYPAKLYARSSQNQTSHNFGGLTVSKNESQGASLELKEDSVLSQWGGPWFSARFNVDQQRGQSTTNYFGRIFRSDQTFRSIAVSADKGFRTSDLRFQYRANEQSDALTGQAANLSQSASLSHSLDFGPGLNRSLSSSVSYATSRALERYSTFAVSEALHIDHFQNLASDTTYNYTRDESGGFVTVVQSGGFAASHQLFKNLSTSIRLNGSQNSLPSGAVAFFNGQITQNYHHSLPHGGNLSANWSGSYQRSSNTLRSGTLPVTREPHAAPAQFALGFLLGKPFVLVDSIKVFNVTSGVRKFIAQSAYNIKEEGNFVRITPLYLDINDPDPLIKKDDALEVDYSYQVDARLENETRSLGYGLNVSYGWIAGGYQHEQTEQNPLYGGGRFLISTRNDGVNFGLSGTLLGLPLSASVSRSRGISRGFYGQEQEDRTRLNVESSGRALGMDARGTASMERFRGAHLSYDLRQVAATLLWLPDSTNWNLSFGANASSMKYLVPARQTSAMSARGSLNWDANGGWRNSAFFEIRTNSDGSTTRQTVLRLGGRTAFRLGKLALSSGVYFDHLTSGASNANSQSLDISLTRGF